MTRVWVDADACPRPVKDILFRAADRRKVDVILVANASMAVPRSARVRSLTVPHGFDAADDYIVEHSEAGDMVVTQDIPLAAQLVEKGVAVINPRGAELDGSNIGERLSVRNFMDEMRGAGMQTGGPSAFGERDKQAFANGFDRVLTRLLQQR
ncbi:MAG: YaiI/YqxD family protein [Pseudomonadales bacterium]|nr:YaiI/YqxD family protein [Pseudomonadales bacterium]MEE2892977.1 YaiI/YqxD family protein [Pseudomonadota bacterium]